MCRSGDNATNRGCVARRMIKVFDHANDRESKTRN
jgi:hypothetical protein